MRFVQQRHQRIGSRICEGRETNDGKKYGFRIVHHALYSPRKNDGNCYYSNKERAGDLPLGDLVGVRGLLELNSWIDLGVYHDSEYSGPSVLDLREWTTLFRRLHLPITRKRVITQLEQEIGNGANDIYLYLPDTLKSIAEEGHTAVD
jgi:hypothetical protein